MTVQAQGCAATLRSYIVIDMTWPEFDGCMKALAVILTIGALCIPFRGRWSNAACNLCVLAAILLGFLHRLGH